MLQFRCKISLSLFSKQKSITRLEWVISCITLLWNPVDLYQWEFIAQKFVVYALSHCIVPATCYARTFSALDDVSVAGYCPARRRPISRSVSFSCLRAVNATMGNRLQRRESRFWSLSGGVSLKCVFKNNSLLGVSTRTVLSLRCL